MRSESAVGEGEMAIILATFIPASPSLILSKMDTNLKVVCALILLIRQNETKAE
jgi:hypothetical protein